MKNYMKTASALADLLDNKFKIMGMNFGIDPILGLIPGGGDLISLILALYIVWIGIKIKLPQNKLKRIVGKALTNSYHKRLAYLEGKKIIALSEYSKLSKISHSNLINKANRQTIEAFLEKGNWKIGIDDGY